MKKSKETVFEVPKAVMDRLGQLVAAMQKPQHAAAVEALFRATPEELGEAAVRGAKLTEQKGRA
jgi:predicted transcriptional regulator